MILLAFSTNLFSQEPEIDLNKLLAISDSKKLSAKIQYYISQYKGAPLAFYLEAVTESNANKANEKFKLLAQRFPHSKYAELARIKSGQYYFSRGLYITARKHFLELIEKYPQSDLVDDAMYLAAACLFASGKFKSCYTELKNFLAQNPRSEFVKLAKEDLKEISDKGDFVALSTNLSLVEGKYALQIGAFKKVNNALNLKNYCEKLGLPVEIREKRENASTVYLVWIGSFKTRSDAALFGDKFKGEHGKPYRIVTR